MKAIDAINEQHSLLESNYSPNEESLDTSGENLKRAVLNEFASIKSKVDEMFGERTGIIIEQVVILVVTEDGTVQEFIKNKYDYLEPLVETIAEWRRKNEVSIDSVDMPVSAGMRS